MTATATAAVATTARTAAVVALALGAEVAEFVGEFLQGRRIALRGSIVPNAFGDLQLAWCEIHGETPGG